MTDKKTLDVANMAKLLRQSEFTVGDKCRKKEIPATKVGGNWIITEEKFFDWLNNPEKYRKRDPAQVTESNHASSLKMKCPRCGHESEVSVNLEIK